MKKTDVNITLQEPQLPRQLDNARRNHGGMTVPDDFFAQFERKMNAVIDADIALRQSQPEARKPELQVSEPQSEADASQPASPVIGWTRYVSVAAAVVALVALTLFVRQQGVVDTPDVAPDQFAAAEPVEAPASEVQEAISEDVIADASDYDIYEYYCDML